MVLPFLLEYHRGRREVSMYNTNDELGQRHAAGCVRAFLRGKQNINWVMAFLKGHRLPKPVLSDILAKAQTDAEGARYEELLSACRNEGLL
jgi:hypothetical protein